MRTTTLLILLALASPALAVAETVTLQTADGLTIKGTLYPSGRKGAAGVVALHMYRKNRSSWKPIAERFTKAGMDFLAIDMRGHGESSVQGEVNLAENATASDPKLFNAMWQDALAARDYLVGKGSDPNRIAFLGASVGCSVAIDATVRSEKIRGACVMTPGKKYLGVDTMAHLKGYGDRSLLVLSSEEEAGKGARAIKDALGGRAEMVLFKAKGVHGTNMFGKVKGVEDRIVTWFAQLLGAPVALDGRADDVAGEPVTTVESPAGKKVAIHARRVGRWLHVAFRPEKGDEAPLEIDVAWAYSSNVTSARSVYWSAKVDAYRYRVMKNKVWTVIRRRKAAHQPDPSAARGEVIEILIPLGAKGVGLRDDPELRLLFFCRGGYGDLTTGWVRPL